MLLTRIRPAIVLAACALLCGSGRPDEKKAPTAPPLTREHLERDLKARLAGRSPDEARAVLEQFAQEWAARKGAREVARQRFTAYSDELGKTRFRLAALKEPEVKSVPLVLRAADVDAAIKVGEQLAEYRAARAQHLEAIVTTTKTFLKLGSEFTTAHGAAETYFNLMADAPKLAASVPADKLPAAFAPKSLEADAQVLRAGNTEVKEALDKSRDDLNGLETALTSAKAASAKTAAELDELKRTRDAKLAAFAYEEQLKGMAAAPLTDEFNRLRKLLAEKTAAIKGDEADYKKTAAPVAEARAKLDAVKDPVPTAPVGERSSLAAAARDLAAAQSYLAARARATDEREEKAKVLVAALDEQEKRALAYSTTLDDLRRTAGQLAAASAEIERRVGRGDLEPAKVPDGVAEATNPTGARAKFDAEAAAVQTALVKLRSDRDAIRKPDAEADGAKALVAALLANVNERIDLHTDLKKLAADYATARPNRSEAEQKRMDQRAAERMAKEDKQWDLFLALDRTKQSTDLASLLDAYYKELVELDEREDNLQRQKEALDKLVALTRKEADNVAKLRALVEKQLAALPAPTAQPNSIPTVGAASVPRTPAERWNAWLGARLAPDGLKAEADAYHAEAARLGALGGANARRVLALTGNPPSEGGKTAEQSKLSANGGDIGKARGELLEARARGLTILGIKIGLVLLGALIIPRLVMFVLRRAIRGGTDDAGNPAPVLRPLRAVLRLVVWAAALAVVLSILGYDVTAFVVALAIGALAVALAARPMIADVLGSVAIFAERRFKVGDVVRLGSGEPARVVGLTWRSIALKNANGMVSSVPNRTVTEVTVENLSRGTETYDTLAVTISTDKDAGKVINVIRAAMAQCKNLSADQGVTVISYVQKGAVKLVQYRFWWFLKDYEMRNKTRDEVFARVAVGLAHEDMTGIEIALA